MLRHMRCSGIGLAFGLLSIMSLALVGLLLLTLPVRSQAGDGATAAHSAPTWNAQYWNNMYLSGAPVLERGESMLDHDWAYGSPDPRIPVDRFSARWDRYVDFAAGNYRFWATSDDGIRVRVDHEPLIERWHDHGAETFEAERYLSAGHHYLQVEYYENEGLALARLNWNLQEWPGTDSERWLGEYYNNRDLLGAPVLVRESDRIDFDWGSSSPEPGLVDADNFSIRWRRHADLAAGMYLFRITSDDGARLWVNDHLLIDAWTDQSATSYDGKIYLQGGRIPLRLEYYEHLGTARIRLEWRRDQGDGNWKPGTEHERWRAEYFDNRALSGSPALVRYDARVDFDWQDGSPAPGRVGEDNFSVRWTRAANFADDEYRFTVACDDGVRLYVDDRLVMDEWHDMSRTRMHSDVDLDKGYHTIRMEYYEHYGLASANLGWERIEDRGAYIGNIITCVPPQPANQAWIKLYRLDGSDEWQALGPGFGSIEESGFLKIDGLPVDVGRFGSAGEPYRVEQWVGGQLANSVGHFQIGEPEFRVRPFADNFTPWQCA